MPMTLRSTVIMTLCILFAVTLFRAIALGHLSQPSGRRTWLMFFLSVLACSFWGEAAEMRLDRNFGGLPIALYLKYFCLVGVCHLYWQLLQDVVTMPASTRWLKGLVWAACGLGVVSFIDVAVRNPISRADLRFIVIGARDAVVCVYIFAGFFRGTWMVLRRGAHCRDAPQADGDVVLLRIVRHHGSWVYLSRSHDPPGHRRLAKGVGSPTTVSVSDPLLLCHFADPVSLVR
jgi:hypothetical protein